MLKKKEIPSTVMTAVLNMPEKTVKQPEKTGNEVTIKNTHIKTVSKVKEDLTKELTGILPMLDEEGLAFLIKQARVHLYNMKVDELNIAAQDAHKASLLSGKIASQKKAKKNDVFKFDATGSGYYLRYQNNGAIFSKSEMVSLVKVVNGSGTAAEITSRLYKWFVKERPDIFMIIPLTGSADSRLKTLAGLIKKNFNLKKKSP